MTTKTILLATLGLAAAAAIPVLAAQNDLFPQREGAKPPLPGAVPAGDVFTREQIGHALSPPTPSAGRTIAAPAAAPKDDGQWTMPGKNYAATRYTALNEITPANARDLREEYSFSIGVDKGQEAAPSVVTDTM
jgi:hypothetical protein